MKTDNTNSSASKSIVTQLLIAGSAACLADTATFPFDTAKVRLQLQGESTISGNRRVGSNNTKNLLKIQVKRPLTTDLPSHVFGPTGRGFISTAFHVPTHEVAAQMDKIPRTTIQYRGLFGTIATIAKQEGTRGLYGGLSAGLQRQMVIIS